MAVSTPPEAVSVVPPSLWVHRGRPPRMTGTHRHDDVEINVVLQGRLDYLFGGSQLTVQAGQVAVFWAATPHRLLDSQATTRGCWMHLPLATVLSWGLGEAQVGRLLQLPALITAVGDIVHDPDRLFATWQRELGDPGRSAPALLEVQALLRRVLSGAPPTAGAGDVDHGGDDDDHRVGRTMHTGRSPVLAGVTRMAQFVVEHFQEPITIADIAAAAHLNRTYAATIFSRTLGVTLGQYLSRRRVAEAQRLLITGDASMIDVAHRCGFGSQSSFYEQFNRWCGVAPGVYRRNYGRSAR